MGTESGPQLELLEEVAEANWLLRRIWHSVEGVRYQTRRMAVEVERVKVRRELEELREEAEGLCDESSEDSESSGLWKTASKELEGESNQWDPEPEESGESEDMEESEGSELEVEKEMDKEVDKNMT